MKHRKIVVTSMDDAIADLAGKTGHRLLATWAADCAERVLPLFEQKRPGDDRPRKAIEACRAWVRTGEFRMAAIRGSSLAAHAAARSVIEDDVARSAARAAGQAVAAAHVGAHAIAAARYAATAVWAVAGSGEADSAALREREWQYGHLRELAGEKTGNS
jgi:hypothetical protein